MALRSAAQTALTSDVDYVRLLDAQSTWPTEYVMSTTQPWDPTKRAIDGQQTVHVGAAQVDMFNRLMADHTRMRRRASQHRPSTELFGTAPYVAVGRGTLRGIDSANSLWFGSRATHLNQPRRVIMEQPVDRFEFLDIRPSAADLRLGAMTRVGPQYVRPGRK